MAADAAFRDDHTTPADTVARESCNEVANMVVVKSGCPRSIRWLIRRLRLHMPSLFRFLTVIAVIAGVVYGVIFALANFVNPKPREMTVTIPADKFLKK
jgi:hypothetical protein